MNFGNGEADFSQYEFMGKRRPQTQRNEMTYKKFFLTLSSTCVLAIALLALSMNGEEGIKNGTSLFQLYDPVYKADEAQCSYARVLGAAYGLNDVTRYVAHLYNGGERYFRARQEMFGQGLEKPGEETLTIVFDMCGNVAVKTVANGETIHLP